MNFNFIVTVTFTLAVANGLDEWNEFKEEFKKSRLGSGVLKNNFDDIIFIEFEAPDIDIPDEVDWSALGAVTKVKDQSQCASAWAFGATGALEGQYFRKTGKLVALSELNLADCSTDLGNGSGGGDIISGFKYVHNNDGIDSEEGYSSTPGDMQCHYDVEYNVTSMTNKVLMIKDASEESLKVAIALYGPVAVSVEASHTSFQMYTNGIYYEEKYATESDHSVLAVGYGTQDGQDYWLVKNSWGVAWGEDGYIKMARNKENNCGIASFAVLPILYK